MGGSAQPKNLHDRKYSASFPISESDTLPLRRSISFSDQRSLRQGRKHKLIESLDLDRSPSFLLNSHGVVCFPFQHAGPHYLIGHH